MEQISTIKMTILAVLGAIGSFAVRLLGGWSTDLATLVMFMSIDFILGLIVAGIFKKSRKSESGALRSMSAWIGLCKKGVTLIFVLIAHRLDLALGLDYVRTATIIGFMVNELISIVENTGLMGIKLPIVLTKAIEILNDKGDVNNE